MCLHIVHRKKNLPKWGIGYKVFTSKMRGIFYGSEPYKISSTYNDKHVQRISSLYESGYHIFKNLNDATTWASCMDIVVKVRYSNLTAIGVQGEYKHRLTVVAKTMTLLEKIVR